MDKREIRIYLRALELEDYQTTIKWRKDPEMWEKIAGPTYFVSEAYEKKWIEDRIFSKDYITLATCLKENDSMIGLISFSEIDRLNRRIRFYGKMIGREYWSKGYATEMLMLALHYIFFNQGFERVYGYNLASNDYTMRVNDKCGAVTEGVLRKSLMKNGELVDERIFGILKEDYAEKAKEYGLIE